MPFGKNILLDRPTSLEFPEITTIYNRFAALQAISSNLGGSLLLHAWLDPDGVALSMAANVAGAASLCIEPEAFLAKQALRGGVCDFLVNDLDEALRILKNEIRKARPVSVVLTGEPEQVVAEAIERGLQPDIVQLKSEGADIAGVATLLARGARRLPIDGLLYGMIPVHWSVVREPLRWLPLADALAANSLDPSDPTTAGRRHWVENGARYLGRTFAAQRFLRMTPSEADAFFAAVQRNVEAGEIQVAVSVVRNGAEELVLS
jgi:Urocanase Rossmann-like domain